MECEFVTDCCKLFLIGTTTQPARNKNNGVCVPIILPTTTTVNIWKLTVDKKCKAPNEWH